MRRVVCLDGHKLQNGNIICSFFGCLVSKECCEEHKKKIEEGKTDSNDEQEEEDNIREWHESDDDEEDHLEMFEKEGETVSGEQK